MMMQVNDIDTVSPAITTRCCRNLQQCHLHRTSSDNHQCRGLKSWGGKKLQFSDIQLQIFNRRDERSKFQLAPKYPTKKGFAAQNIAFLDENFHQTSNKFMRAPARMPPLVRMQ